VLRPSPRVTRMRLDRTAAEVAALLGGRVEGPAGRRLAALQSLQAAGADDLAPVFGTAPGAAAALAATRAGALLAGERAELPAAAGPRSVIRVPDADLALDALVLALAPAEDGPAPGVHPSAILGADVTLGPGASIGPHAVLGRGARIGARTVLRAGACVGAHAVLGEDVTLGEHVVIGSRCVLGDRVTVHAGSVIGKDGFGFRQDRDGRHRRIPQRGIVVLGDDVEVGALCTIDRARFTETRLGAGCKLDNHVHLAHNVELGEHCAFAAQVGVAGSTSIGRRVLVGGHSGIGNGLTVGDRAVIGGYTGVVADVPPGSFVTGFPAVPNRTWARDLLQVRRLGPLVARVKALEQAAGLSRGPATGEPADAQSSARAGAQAGQNPERRDAP
jgi:UDP-3-O-[3-hydroxymyristoyl] glucosamine N-acyltransferase